MCTQVVLIFTIESYKNSSLKVQNIRIAPKRMASDSKSKDKVIQNSAKL